MKWILLSIVFLVSVRLSAQSNADSLLQILPTLRDDSLKMEVYIQLEQAFLRTSLNQALEYISKAEALVRQLNLPMKEAEIKCRKSYILTELKLFSDARAASEGALEIFNQLEASSWIAEVKMQLGSISKFEGKNEEASTHYYQALTIFREIGDKNREAMIHNYLGSLYKIQKQFQKALENYERALALVREIDIKAGISACLTNIADIYNQMKQYQKAILYHRQALEIKRQTADKLGEARVLNSMGVVHNNLSRFSEAEEYFNQAIELAQNIGDEWLVTASTYGLSKSAAGQGEYERSIKMQLDILPAIRRFKDKEFQLRVHQSLAEIYAKLGDHKNAYARLLMAKSLSDSLYNEKILTVTNDLEAKYQNEQKSQEIALLASEKEVQDLLLTKRKNERNGVLGFAALLLLTAGLLYNRFQIKQRSNRKLKQLDQLKSNFFANISHEFRTPLTLIKGPIERLEQNPEDKLEKEEIRMIRRNANKVLSLVNQLLDLSRIDRGKLQLRPTESNVFKCLNTAASSFNSHAAQRHMDYRVEIPNEVLWASFDREKLEQIVYNLLSNAFKFSDDEEQVTFEVKYVGAILQIQVMDSGRGIPTANLPFIFDRFYQVDDAITKEREGSGIGLSLVKDLVDLMDGTITVSSELGKGSFFTVQIPIEKIETHAATKDEVEVLAEEAINNSRTYELKRVDNRDLPKILLVEDNEDMRQFIRPQLINNYCIIEAVNGEDGFIKAKNSNPNLIITDLMMPKMDGMTLCHKLKSDLSTSHVPVIMLTAKAGIDNKLEGLETGADDYLTKPFNSRELQVRATNLITQRKKLRESFAAKNTDPARVTVTSIDEKFLHKVLEILENHYEKSEFGIPQMQETLGMSKSQLHRKLKALTNETPGELLRNFRLKRAAQLLSQDAENISQIAYSVGFNDLSYFTKCFKSVFGVVPSAYRK